VIRMGTAFWLGNFDESVGKFTGQDEAAAGRGCGRTMGSSRVAARRVRSSEVVHSFDPFAHKIRDSEERLT
jgi:hypothetical protein